MSDTPPKPPDFSLSDAMRQAAEPPAYPFQRVPTQEEVISGMFMTLAEKIAANAESIEKWKCETAKVNAGVEETKAATRQLQITKESDSANKRLWLYGFGVLCLAVVMVASVLSGHQEIAQDALKAFVPLLLAAGAYVAGKGFNRKDR